MSAGRTGRRMRGVIVVVPARDEEDELPGCLGALHAACGRLAMRGVATNIVVTADRCLDRTATIARALGADVVECDAGAAGAARAAGFAEALGRSRLDPADVWLVTTDADSRVPTDWLTRQLSWAARGWDAVAGTVRVADWSAHPPGSAAAFTARYDSWTGRSPHVHGANLGCSADAYLEVGGFPPLVVGEDRALVDALEAAGRRVLRTSALRVLTSARLDCRAPGGFGHDLREQALTLEAAPATRPRSLPGPGR
ncbi:glycosyltransferase [Embleya sp. NPDC059237]|uniref:glycosyltransferase n=1 Tax=Embleya sp. NPDC059237 TaxID=3346784 RepID=UPI0036C4AF95